MSTESTIEMEKELAAIDDKMEKELAEYLASLDEVIVTFNLQSMSSVSMDTYCMFELRKCGIMRFLFADGQVSNDIGGHEFIRAMVGAKVWPDKDYFYKLVRDFERYIPVSAYFPYCSDRESDNCEGVTITPYGSINEDGLVDAKIAVSMKDGTERKIYGNDIEWWIKPALRAWLRDWDLGYESVICGFHEDAWHSREDVFDRYEMEDDDTEDDDVEGITPEMDAESVMLDIDGRVTNSGCQGLCA